MLCEFPTKRFSWIKLARTEQRPVCAAQLNTENLKLKTLSQTISPPVAFCFFPARRWLNLSA